MLLRPYPELLGCNLLANILLLLLRSQLVYSQGINCRGSLYCLGQDQNNVTGRILGLTNKILPSDIYGLGAHIACLGATDPLRGNTGAFCLFMQGNNAHGIYNPVTGARVIGIDGKLIKLKIEELYGHGCRACGSVPISDDNDPNEEGILTLNYVSDNAGCHGFTACAPTIAASDKMNNPFNAGLDEITSTDVVNSTANGLQDCAQPGSPVVVDANGVPMDECNAGFPSPNPSAKTSAKAASKGSASPNIHGRPSPRVNLTSQPTPTPPPTTIKTMFSSSSTSLVSAGSAIKRAVGCHGC